MSEDRAPHGAQERVTVDGGGCPDCLPNALVVAASYAQAAGLPILEPDKLICVCTECRQVFLAELPRPGGLFSDALRILPGAEMFPWEMAEQFVEPAKRKLAGWLSGETAAAATLGDDEEDPFGDR